MRNGEFEFHEVFPRNKSEIRITHLTYILTQMFPSSVALTNERRSIF